MQCKDDSVLLHVGELRLATRALLSRLTGRNNSWLNESLRRMVRQKKLYCRRQGRWQPIIYATYDIRRREDFEHDLALSEIHVALAETGALLDWNQPRQKLEGQLNEDTSFELACPGGFIKYYLEYETGKNAWYQVDDKFKRYLDRRSQERFHVLFVLKDEQLKTVKQMTSRAERFVDRSKDSAPKIFLFTTQEHMIRDPLGPICHIALDDKTTYALLPASKSRF